MSALRDHAHLLFPTQEPCACQSRAHAPWQQTAVNHPRTAAPVLVVQRHRLEGGGGGGNGVLGTVVVGIAFAATPGLRPRGLGGRAGTAPGGAFVAGSFAVGVIVK